MRQYRCSIAHHIRLLLHTALRRGCIPDTCARALGLPRHHPRSPTHTPPPTIDVVGEVWRMHTPTDMSHATCDM